MLIAVVDDDKNERDRLIEMLGRYSDDHHVSLDCREFDSAEAFFQDFSGGKFQLVMFDIYMGGQDGMSAARRVCSEDESCRIIFTTTSREHAVESYEVRASYYLLKPFEYEKLSKALDIVCAESQQSERCIRISTRGVSAEVKLQDILYTDMSDRRLHLHLKDKVLKLTDRPADIIDQLLKDERFMLCNRSIVVNMDQISAAQEEDFLMKNGDLVPMKKRERAGLRRQYVAYSLTSLRRDQTI